MVNSRFAIVNFTNRLYCTEIVGTGERDSALPIFPIEREASRQAANILVLREISAAKAIATPTGRKAIAPSQSVQHGVQECGVYSHKVGMARRKKQFPCGHKGYGQVCHRCLQKQEERAKRQEAKQLWEETFTHDPIDLSFLPKNVVIKARKIITGIEKQQDYRAFRGKRLRHDRFIISIPVTRNYRLLCRDCGNILVPEAVISHEDYNVCKPGG